MNIISKRRDDPVDWTSHLALGQPVDVIDLSKAFDWLAIRISKTIKAFHFTVQYFLPKGGYSRGKKPRPLTVRLGFRITKVTKLERAIVRLLGKVGLEVGVYHIQKNNFCVYY